MARDFAKAFYRSSAWLACRTAYIASVFNLCERCRKPGKILHHKKPLTPNNINDPEIALGFNNLRFLCHACHEAEHSDTYVTRKDVRFDDKGSLVQAKPIKTT
jgi:thymidine kinase